jgi:hypothetical protein
MWLKKLPATINQLPTNVFLWHFFEPEQLKSEPKIPQIQSIGKSIKNSPNILIKKVDNLLFELKLSETSTVLHQFVVASMNFLVV